MTPSFLLRYLVLAVALLLLTIPVGSSVSARESFSTLAYQDFGDDDGDGIPNELDPDDNNNGIVDQEDDSPSPTGETPNETAPNENVGTNPAAPVKSSPKQSNAAIVTSLPETGVGAQPIGYSLLAVITLIPGAAWSIRFQNSKR